MKKTILLPIFVFVSSSQLAIAKDPPKAAALCIGCHGMKGVSSNDLWPNLAGQKKGYLAKQLLAFKTGERKDPMMSPLSTSLENEDIQALAEYFSTL